MAQTERNRVQSQARADALHEAAQAGVIVTKKWSARMRNTRDSHAALNGVEIPENEKFRTIWGNELRYPGDPEAPAAEVINCHCVLIPDVKLPPENSAVRLKKEAESGIIKGSGGALETVEKDLPKQKTSSIRKSILSLSNRVKIHEMKIAFPEQYDVGWAEKNELQRNGLLKHWQKELKTFKDSIERRENELRRRGEM